MAYEVSTPVFEGPFDLLLHLITKDQLDIYEISLARIVDAYVASLERMEQLDLEVATEFLLIAATLVELKLRRLLPGPEGVELDEDLSLLEERDLLLAKLLECATFKESGRMMARLLDRWSRSYPRALGPDEQFTRLVPDLLAGITPVHLADAYRKVMVRSLTPTPAPRVVLDHVTPVRLTVAETVDVVAAVMARAGTSSLRELTADCEQRIEVIVHFLALLELYKQGWVELEQFDSFGDVVVVWCPDGPEADGTRGAAPVEVLVGVDAYDG